MKVQVSRRLSGLSSIGHGRNWAVLINFIVGRCTASAIASASRKSFFYPFEYGRTYFAGISRAS